MPANMNADKKAPATSNDPAMGLTVAKNNASGLPFIISNLPSKLPGQASNP
jgi:hypothetical protein